MRSDFREQFRRFSLSELRRENLVPRSLRLSDLKETAWFVPALLVLLVCSLGWVLFSVARNIDLGPSQPKVTLTTEEKLVATITEDLHAADEQFILVGACLSPEEPTEILLVGLVHEEESLDDLERWVAAREFPYPVKIQVEVLE